MDHDAHLPTETMRVPVVSFAMHDSGWSVRPFDSLALSLSPFDGLRATLRLPNGSKGELAQDGL